MSADDETKTTTVFDGKQENYGKYRMKLRGEFCAKGIQSALGSKFKDVLPATEDATSQTVKQKEAVKSNIGGMGVLIKTNKSEEILVLLNSTVSDDWPWGRVDLAMALLDEMFRPTDTMAKAQQKKKLGELTMKDSEDPHGFGLKIASLELEFNNTLSDEDKMATLIGVAGSRYATTIRGEKKLFESKGEEITFKALLTAIRDVWRLSGKNSSAGRNEGEKALGSVQPGAFAGNCFKCGKPGHRSFECESNGTASSGGGKKCEHEDCGLFGHSTEDCWEDPKNEGRRPKNWVSRKKRKNGEANGSHVEIFL